MDYPEEINRYNKRVEDLIEDAEIEAELEAENKVRSKNTRLFLISIVGIGLLVFIYLGINMPFEEKKPAALEETSMARTPDEPKPIPFLKPTESTEKPSQANKKGAGASPEKNIFEPPHTQATEKFSIANDIQAIKKSNGMGTKKVEQTTKPIAVKKSIPKRKIKTTVKKIAVKVGPKADVKILHKPVPQKAVKVQPKPDTKTPSKPTATKPAASAPQKGYMVQVGVFSLKSNADKFIESLKVKGLNPAIRNRPTQRLMNVVFVGDYKDRKSTREPLEELKKAGFEPSLKQNSKNRYTFVLGKFKTADQADLLRDKLSLKGFLSGVKKTKIGSTNYVVQLGAFQTKEEALSKQQRMEQLGYKKAFIRTVG